MTEIVATPIADEVWYTSVLGEEDDYDHMNGLTVVDSSQWQCKLEYKDGKLTGNVLEYMDFKQCREAGADGVVLRCSNGTLPDIAFHGMWARAEAEGYWPMVYHAFHPQWGVEQNLDIIRKQLKDYEPQFFWLDCERNGGMSPSTTTNRTIEMVGRLLTEYPGNVGIYTRMSWWNANIIDGTAFGLLPLMVARYSDYLEWPWVESDPAYLKPRDWGWNGWTMWQWSADGNNQGEKYGSKGDDDIDLNRVLDPEFLKDKPSNGGGQMNKYFEEAVEQAEYCRDKGLNYILELPVIDFDEVVDPGNGNGGNGGDPPPPPSSGNVQVTDDKTLAHKIAGENNAGYPIMGIYPSDSQDDVSKRIRFNRGDEIAVYKDKVRSDGAKFWYLMVTAAEDGTPLYVFDGDVAELW